MAIARTAVLIAESWMPGIAEETLFALEAKQPLYLLGGFGSCARDIAEGIGLIASAGAAVQCNRRDYFNGFSPESLSHGLELEGNRTLARTVHVDEAVALFVRGMLRLARRKAQ
jgi:hypothetical protein